MIDFIAHHAGLFGLLFFFFFFCVIVLWTFRTGARSKYDSYAQIPLKENDE